MVAAGVRCRGRRGGKGPALRVAAVAEPAPAAPVAKAPKGEGGENENYLDDIEAMESELTAGWDEADGEPGDAKKAPSEGDSARS